MFVITGGGTGLGRALALALSQHEKEVLIIGRRKACLQECAAHSKLIQYLCADVSTEEGILAVKHMLSTYSAIEGLVNNAGTLNPICPISEITPTAWDEAIKTNLNAPLFLSQALYPQLTGGRVLNIGSGAAYVAIQGWSAYCATKAALAMLTQCWQQESSQVLFASVMPGISDTTMQAIAREGKAMDSEQVHFYRKLKEHNRLISPETVASFLLWLLLDVAPSEYVAKEWDIYDTSHHQHWLKSPHQVLHWEF